jgi:hypothetical protein
MRATNFVPVYYYLAGKLLGRCRQRTRHVRDFWESSQTVPGIFILNQTCYRARS